MKKRDEALERFIEWKAHAERRFDKNVKIFHTDGAGEFCSNRCKDYYRYNGIEHQTTQPYSSEMNGDVEIFMKILIHTASSMLNTAGIRLDFWGQAVLCANFITNRCPTKGLRLKSTPYEALYGSRPYIGHFRIWGCRAYAHISDKKRKKLDPHNKEYLHMGYTDAENMFQLYDIEGKCIIKCRDVVFFEHVLSHESVSRNINERPSGPNRNILDQPMDDVSDSDSDSTENLDNANIVPQIQFSQLCAANFDTATPFAKNLPSLKIPRSFPAAMRSPQSLEWQQACATELNALQRNHTWDLVDLPLGKPVISNKWVFDIKTSRDNANNPRIERYKARLVARCDSQSKGLNYDEVYAPVIQFVSLRIILHIAASLDLEID